MKEFFRFFLIISLGFFLFFATFIFKEKRYCCPYSLEKLKESKKKPISTYSSKIIYLRQITSLPKPTKIKQNEYITKKPYFPEKPEKEEWGVVKKIDDYTYTIAVGQDERMSTKQELLDALNNYRLTHGKQPVSLNETISNYAQERALYFQKIEGTDKHEGLHYFLDNENGFEKLGCSKVGENSYYGVKLTGTHLIEWIFGQSPTHNSNQLDESWTSVGIGITDVSADIIFCRQ